MEITVNGSVEAVEASSIADFLAAKGLDGAGVVVEHNYKSVKRSDWETTRLQDRDNLEILRFVGGG